MKQIYHILPPQSKVMCSMIRNQLLDFINFFHHQKLEAQKSRCVKYKIHSTMLDFKKTRKIQLALTDKPGDFLPLMDIQEIKKKPDLLSGLHPIDVNSINDLFYLTCEQVKQLKINGDIVNIVTKEGVCKEYDITQTDLDRSISTRLPYIMACQQAEKLMNEVRLQDEKYLILRDYITYLQVLNKETNQKIMMNPNDILFSDEYKNFSKKDIIKIGYICGQLSKI